MTQGLEVPNEKEEGKHPNEESIDVDQLEEEHEGDQEQGEFCEKELPQVDKCLP